MLVHQDCCLGQDIQMTANHFLPVLPVASLVVTVVDNTVVVVASGWGSLGLEDFAIVEVGTAAGAGIAAAGVDIVVGEGIAIVEGTTIAMDNDNLAIITTLSEDSMAP